MATDAQRSTGHWSLVPGPMHFLFRAEEHKPLTFGVYGAAMVPCLLWAFGVAGLLVGAGLDKKHPLPWVVPGVLTLAALAAPLAMFAASFDRSPKLALATRWSALLVSLAGVSLSAPLLAGDLFDIHNALLSTTVVVGMASVLGCGLGLALARLPDARTGRVVRGALLVVASLGVLAGAYGLVAPWARRAVGMAPVMQVEAVLTATPAESFVLRPAWYSPQAGDPLSSEERPDELPVAGTDLLVSTDAGSITVRAQGTRSRCRLDGRGEEGTVRRAGALVLLETNYRDRALCVRDAGGLRRASYRDAAGALAPPWAWSASAIVAVLAGLLLAARGRSQQTGLGDPSRWTEAQVVDGDRLRFPGAAGERAVGAEFAGYRGPVVVVPLGETAGGVFRSDGAPTDGYVVPGTIERLREVQALTGVQNDLLALAVAFAGAHPAVLAVLLRWV